MLGLMGFAGGLATQFVLPYMGAIFDGAKISAAGGVDALRGLSGDELATVIRVASVESFQVVAVIPLALVPVFAILWLRERGQQKAALEG